MTKAHPKKLVGIQFDVAKDADVIERIYGQPSIVGYIRKLVRQDMQGDGYVELPKDADGEYIHIGDVMEWPITGETFEVVAKQPEAEGEESETFAEGELFVYVNGDRWELGMVKRPNRTGDGYFCWYSTGDTAANTPTRCMHKLANSGYTKIEGQLSGKCHVVEDEFGYLTCSECGAVQPEEYTTCYCWNCGRKVVSE